MMDQICKNRRTNNEIPIHNGTHKGTSRTRRHFFFNKNTFLLVQQENTFSSSTRTHFSLFNKKTLLLLQQEHISSCSTRRHFFFFNKNTFLLVQQEDIFSCRTKPYTLTEIMEKDMIQMTTKASMKVHLIYAHGLTSSLFLIPRNLRRALALWVRA